MFCKQGVIKKHIKLAFGAFIQSHLIWQA